jgi:hypothetical protein
VYITPNANLDKVNVQTVNRDFVAFILKTYGVRTSAQCPAARDEAALNRTRQSQIDDLKRTVPKTRTVKFVDVDWKPAPIVADATSASKPAATPPPTPALDAYQKALAAGQPRSNAAPPDKPATAAMTFCYAIGTPTASSGGKQSHAYVTKLFSSPAGAQADTAFQKSLSSAHPDENISRAVCQASTDTDSLQGTRQEFIADQRKVPSRAVIDVDWKGGQ